MKNETHSRVRVLLDRLNRLIASEDWADDLNPAQRSALGYLARANRFSRSPSQVADYLCTTRGTASQTLKALEKKGFITRSNAVSDGRAISYDVTPKGSASAKRADGIYDAMARMSVESSSILEAKLSELIRNQLEARQFRSFGICKSCKYHTSTERGPRCRLLQTDLSDEEADQLCHEHSEQ